MLSRALYFVMVCLQLIVVCWVIILYAAILAVLPMVARSSIHPLRFAEVVGRGDTLMS